MLNTISAPGKPQINQAGNLVASRVQQSISPISHVKGMESLNINIAYLPFGPSKAHIEWMVKQGLLMQNDIFIWEKAWKKTSSLDYQNPQVMWLDISWESFTNKWLVSPESGNIFYVGNQEFLKAWSNYLWGRMPTQDEQENIYSLLSWSTTHEQLSQLWVPLVGYFSVQTRAFRWTWSAATLASSTLETNNRSSNILFLSLDIDLRDDKPLLTPEVYESFCNAYEGHSCLVVFDKE